jgi:hypothetical protein
MPDGGSRLMTEPAADPGLSQPHKVQCVGGGGDQLQDTAAHYFASPSNPLDHRMPEDRGASRLPCGAKGRGRNELRFVEEGLEATICQER